MTNLFKKTIIATALAATALAGAAPAMAHDGYGGYYHHDHDGGDGAGIAIGAGIVGLALGAIIASNGHHDDRYERRYVNNGYYGTPYAQSYWTWHDGYYWDRDGNRYEGYRHDDRGYDRRGYGDNGYGGGYRERRDYRDGNRYEGYRGEQRHYEGGRGY